MASDARLRSEARETATRRGHALGYFTEPATAMSYTGATKTGSTARCTNCGAEATVIRGYSYEIFGEAVALDCPGREQR